MLRGIIICPDIDLTERFQDLLAETGYVHVTRTMDRYPSTWSCSVFFAHTRRRLCSSALNRCRKCSKW